MLHPRTTAFSLLSLVFVCLPAAAEGLPATVRACIGEADAMRRLACYDREVARVIAPPGTFAPAPESAEHAPEPLRSAPTAKATPSSAASHLTAKVSAVVQSGDNLIVTLESGDVWEQSAPATSQMNLTRGDTVQLDRESGGWFLTNRYGNNIQVRPRRP